MAAFGERIIQIFGGGLCRQPRRDLQRIRSAEQRDKALERVRAILDEYAEARSGG
jgi:hypothetical protein